MLATTTDKSLDKKKVIIDYILVYLLIAMTGIDFFYRTKMIFLIPICSATAFLFFYRGLKIHKFIAYYAIIFMVVQILQMLKFYYLPLSTYIGLHIRIFYAYFTLRLVGERFFNYYINILFYSTIISFFFYLPSYLPGFEHFLISSIAPIFENPLVNYDTHYTIAPSVLVYTINTEGEGMNGLLRNSGPFWEPGAFAGFLVIALIFNTIIEKSLYSKKNKILLLGLLSTFSSTGIIVIMFIIISYIMTSTSFSVKAIVIPFLLFGAVYAFTSIDFLGDKITGKMDIEEATYNNRFVSAYLDFKDTLENPLLGLGRSATTRFKGVTDELATHRNNGVTAFLVYYGFIIFIAYFYLIYYSFVKMCRFYNYNTKFALYGILMIFLIGFSEGFFTRPLFWGLTMVHLIIAGAKFNNENTKIEHAPVND